MIFTRFILTLVLFYLTNHISAQTLSIIYPKSNEVISDRTPMLIWNGLEGSSSYLISLSTDSTFNSGVQSFSSNFTNYQITSNLASGTWFWKVNCNFNDQDYVSNLGKFQVFQPTDLANLVVWLTSDSLVTLDANNRVSSWGNINSTNNFVNTVATRRPFLTSANPSMNNKKAIDFQGAHFLSSLNNFSFSNASIFLLGSQSSGESAFGRFVDHDRAKGFWIGRDSINNKVGGGFIEPNPPYGNFTSLENDKPIQLTCIRNASTTSYFNNSTSFSNPERNSSGATTTSNKIFLGSNISSGQFGRKKIYDLVIYSSNFIYSANLNVLLQKLVEKYQMDKFAPPVNLGADITPTYLNNGTCVNQTLSTTNNYSSYIWSTGAISSSINVTQPGTYWVQTIDVFGRTSRDTIIVNYPIMNVFNFEDLTVCYNDSLNFIPNIPTNHTFLNWSDGFTNQSRKFDASKNKKLFYILMKNSSGCIVKSNIFKILVDSSLSKLSLGPDVSFCSGNSVQLKNLPNQPVSYLWNTGNTTSNQIVQTSDNYWLQVTNNQGCTKKDTIYVNVTGEGAKVNSQIPFSACVGTTIPFTAVASITPPETISSYTWSFGNGNTAKGSTTQTIFREPGTMQVKLSILSSNNCQVTVDKFIQVFPKPEVSIVSSLGCKYDTVRFSTNNNGFSIKNYSWSLDQNVTSTLRTPVYFYGRTGSFPINVIASDSNGCSDTSYMNLVINEILEKYSNDMTVVWPKNNEVISDRTPLLSWNGLEGSSSYLISLSTDSTFNSGVQSYSSNSTSHQLTSNLASGTWFWKVNSYSNGQSFVSNLGKFQVFEPTDIGSLAVWLTCDSLVTLDASNRVSSWGNINSTNNFENTVASGRPFITSVNPLMNNNKAIDFRGAQNLSSINNFSFGNTSIFLVGSQASGENAYARFVDHQNSNGFWIGRNNTNNSIGGGFREPSNPFGSFTALQNDIPIQLSLIRNAATTSYFYNSTSFSIPTRTTNSAATSSNKIFLGSSVSSDQFGRKKIYDLIIFSTNLTVTMQRLVEKYQMDKYAPPVNLGADISSAYLNNGTCVNQTLNASNNYVSYLWNTGSSASSINVTRPGTYWVQVTDIFGRISSDTIVVNYPTMNLFSDTTLCAKAKGTIKANLPINHSLIRWNNCNPNITNEISIQNTYFIEFTNNQGCTIRSNAFIVTNGVLNVGLGPDISLCSGNSIQLTIVPSEPLTYLWNTGNTTSNQIVETSGNYWLEVANDKGCFKRDTIYVDIIGEGAQVSAQIPSSACVGSEIPFSAIASITAPKIISSYTWNFGDGNSANGTLTQNIYKKSGTMQVQLIVESSNNCKVTVSKSIQVSPKPEISIISSGNCIYDTIKFSTANNGFTIQNYNWALGQNIKSSLATPIYIYNTSGTFPISVVAKDFNGCIDSSNTILVLEDQFDSYFYSGMSIVWPKHDEVISDRTPLLSWNGLEGSLSYVVSLSTDSTFNSGVQSYSSNSTSHQLTSNLASGTWFWKVNSSLNGQSFVSNLGKFQVFEPTDIGSLAVWLTCDSLVTLDASNRVSSWGNINSSNNFENTVASGRPFITSANPLMNNKKAIDFRGAQNLSSINNFSFGNASIFLVGSQSSGENAYARFVDHQFSNGFWIGRDNTNNRIGGGFRESNPFGSFTALQNDIPIQLSLIRTAATTSYFYNSTSFSIPTRTTNSAATESNKIFLGSSVSSDQFGRKNIYDLIIYSTNLTASMQKLVEKYQMDKYAPPVNLGPDIKPISCLNDTLNAGKTYKEYLWNTGATTSSIQITKPGTYWVIVTDIFGRISMDTIIVNNPQISVFKIYDTTICLHNTLSVNPQIPADHTFLRWNNCYPSPTFQISKPGTYFVEFKNTSGCIIRSNAFEIELDSSLNNMTLGSDTSLCSGDIIQLQNPPTGITKYAWNTGNTKAVQTINTTGSEYILEVTNSNNCRNRDTIQIKVIGVAPIVQYQFTDKMCQFSNGNYSDNSFVPNNSGAIINKTWYISEGTILTGSSGNFNIDTSGIFNVKLLLETQEGCRSAASFPLVIHPKPIVSFSINNYCANESIQFTPINSTIVPLNSALWNFNDNTTSTKLKPTQVFGNTGTYNITLQAEDINGCLDTVSQEVYIQPAPVADFSFNNNCELKQVNFVNNSKIIDTFSVISNQWTYGDGTLATNPSNAKVYQTYGDYDVQLIVTANNGCKDTLTKTITIHPVPLLDWKVGTSCKNVLTTFENKSTIPVGSITQTDWMVNMHYPLKGISSGYKFVTTGLQYLNLTSTSDQGCSSDTLILVNVQPGLEAKYNVSPSIVVAGVPIIFANTSNGGKQYEWNFGNGNVVKTTEQKPIEVPGYATTYIGDSILTYLAIEDVLGCRDTAFQYVKINEPRIDLIVNQLFIQNLNGYFKVGVELKNNGLVDITKVDLVLKMLNSMNFLETDLETLKAGENHIYLFNSSPSSFISEQDNELGYLCVEATSYNDYLLVETELKNNNYCLNTEGGNFVLLPIYPNPTSDDLNYTIIVSEESTLTMSLSDETGRIVQSGSEILSSGIHTPKLSMHNLRPGVYYLQISDGSTSKTAKLMKN